MSFRCDVRPNLFRESLEFMVSSLVLIERVSVMFGGK
jgi:hypothetical protein